MKQWFFIALVMPSWALGAISNEAGLRLWAQNGGDETISGTIVLSANLIITQSGTLTATGATTIDCTNNNHSYLIYLSNSSGLPVEISFIGSYGKRIRFTESSSFANIVSCQGTGGITVNYYHCDFDSSQDGLKTANKAYGPITLNCFYCNAYNNSNDGFSLAGNSWGLDDFQSVVDLENGLVSLKATGHKLIVGDQFRFLTLENYPDTYTIDAASDSDTIVFEADYIAETIDKSDTVGYYVPYPQTMNLVACNSYANQFDGVTLHTNNQYIHVDGGRYYGNGKSGFSLVGLNHGAGGECVIKNATIYDNGGNIKTNGDIYAGQGVKKLVLDGCWLKKFDVKKASSVYGQVNLADCHTAIIKNCLFTDPVDLSSFVVYLINCPNATDPCENLTIDNCRFDGFSMPATNYVIYARSLTNQLIVKNSTFSDCERCIYTPMGNTKYSIDRCAFMDTAMGIYDVYSSVKYASNANCCSNQFDNVIHIAASANTCQVTDFPNQNVGQCIMGIDSYWWWVDDWASSIKMGDFAEISKKWPPNSN